MTSEILLTPNYFIKNVPIPKIAFPTLILLAVCYTIHLTVILMHERRILQSQYAFMINSVSAFAVFTCMHDASHGSIATVSSGVRFLVLINLIFYLIFHLSQIKFQRTI